MPRCVIPKGLFVFALTACFALLSAPHAAAQAVQADEPNPAQKTAQTLWANFAHYVRVAKPDEAKKAADVLVTDNVAGDDLLFAVENSRHADVADQILNMTSGMEGLETVGGTLRSKLQEARLARAQEPARIRADIRQLTVDARTRANATARLREAGQFTAPAFLEILSSSRPEERRLQPFAVDAMVAVGRPLVYPLAIALPNLDGPTLVTVLGVLDDIGDPLAMPAIQQVLDSDLPNGTAAIARSVFSSLAARSDAPANASAADLYLFFAQSSYDAGTEGEILLNTVSTRGQGTLWRFQDRTLSALAVPLPIYPDVRAMQSTRTALDLDPDLTAALSLYTAANLRREIRLPQGSSDPSYTAKPAAFYAMLAGPGVLHTVLARALDEDDPALAFAAIEALSQTAGTETLLNLDRNRQPLLQALAYPDRRVRRSAALVLADTNPTEAFPGSFQIVPILGRTVRQSAQKYAFVLADQEAAGPLRSVLEGKQYTVINAASIDEAVVALTSVPAIDLLVVPGTFDTTRAVLNQTGTNARLAATPVLALVSAGDAVRLNRAFADVPRLTASEAAADDADALGAAVDQAIADYAGDEIPADEAEAMALEALDLLDRVVLDSPVYNPAVIEPVLIEALGDTRQPVAVAAANVLAHLDSDAAQQALLTSAANGFGDLQVALLNSLADSARNFGSRLTPAQAQSLTELVTTADGDTALAASRAHGALALPTSQSVQSIQAD
ncbi:MAG: hypothetical protein AAF750_05225 [Planctomycetota bacterium]